MLALVLIHFGFPFCLKIEGKQILVILTSQQAYISTLNFQQVFISIFIALCFKATISAFRYFVLSS